VDDPALEIVRVLPAHESVRVEWRSVSLPGAQTEKVGAFELQVRLREEGWQQARCLRVSSTTVAAELSGLMNHADYLVRIVGLEATGEVVVCSQARLFTPGWVPGVVIDYLHRDDPVYAFSGRYIGSPSITRLPDGALVACHDVFGRGSQDFTRVFRSDDNGATWRHTADFRPAFWGKLFTHRGRLYHLCTATEYGDVLLRESPDGGESWSEPVVLAEGPYHKAPVPVIEHAGKLWTCVELQTGRWPRGFQSVVLSVPADGELMAAAQWTVSEPLAYDPAWLPEDLAVEEKYQGYLEGNAVVTPDGRLVNLLRYNTVPHHGKALMLDIVDEGRRLQFNRVIDFYGGMSKFTIRRHPDTGVYWSLVNRVTRPEVPTQRSVLTLVSSEDLIHWRVHRDLLRDDRPWAPQYTGFQYVDWLFDGEDLIAACRTAFNGAHNFHDANYLTFHRFKNFASETSEKG